jgi:hypothetical protein
MRTFLPSVGGVVLACVLAAPLHAQEAKGDMHQLVVYNGAARTVHYFGADGAAARDRAARENNASMADLRHALRVQYLQNERAMETRRHHLQMLLYGYTTSYPTSLYPSVIFESFYSNSGWGGWGGWGGYGGYGSPESLGFGTTTHGLQFGIGDEGALKRELILGLGAPPAPKPE